MKDIKEEELRFLERLVQTAPIKDHVIAAVRTLIDNQREWARFMGVRDEQK